MCSSNHQRLLDGLPVENFDVAAMWVLGFGLVATNTYPPCTIVITSVIPVRNLLNHSPENERTETRRGGDSGLGKGVQF